MSSEKFESFLTMIKKRDPEQGRFHQAVEEVLHSIWPFVEKNPRYASYAILERLVEPERVIMFRVPWLDDQGNAHVNRGYRIQMSSAIGPYKGGLRFHPSVTLDILKFLAFEQVFKNALTTLPMGGGKGGSDFDPKGKSDVEVMRFCQSFMTELYRHIGDNVDIPAGDIGVGGREVGYLYGQYKRLANEFSSVMTGKGLAYGGSLIRPEATGFGAVYFAEEMLKLRKSHLAGKTALVSGAGNVAQYAALKLIECDTKVLTMSDSNGFVHFPNGMTITQLEALIELKEQRRERLSVYAKEQNLPYYGNERPWRIPADLAFPCATQNELSGEDAKTLLANGCIGVIEGANMPSTPEAIEAFIKAEISYAPGKASNAGGVAVSGLEMTQNAIRLNWNAAEVDTKLHEIMQSIHQKCVEYGRQPNGFIDYMCGANIAGFKKVADAMLSQGVV